MSQSIYRHQGRDQSAELQRQLHNQLKEVKLSGQAIQENIQKVIESCKLVAIDLEECNESKKVNTRTQAFISLQKHKYNIYNINIIYFLVLYVI